MDPNRSKNDVFLISFRGEDIPETFTEHLLGALDQKGISTIRGDQLEPQEQIRPSDFKPIRESTCAIVIFSPNFANSTWCLDGLAEAVERMRMPEGIAPVFYNVDDGDVKNQRGSFGEAFSQLKQRFQADEERIGTWISALRRVGQVSGWYPQKSRNEDKSIQEIVEKVVIELAAQKEEQRQMKNLFYPLNHDSEEDQELQPLVNNDHISISVDDEPLPDRIMATSTARNRRMGTSTARNSRMATSTASNRRMATSTAWIFLLTNIGLEFSSAMLDQFPSTINKPHSALISMVLAVLAVIISIWELVYKGLKEEVIYRRQLGVLGWFYSPPPDNKIFGSVPDMCGLLGGISQWIYSTVQYVCILRHIENPYKICLWPIIFLLCLGASRLHWN